FVVGPPAFARNLSIIAAHMRPWRPVFCVLGLVLALTTPTRTDSPLIRSDGQAASPAPASGVAKPAAAAQGGFDLQRLQRIDAVCDKGTAEKKLPAAVVLAGHGDTVVFRKAYGNRALVPAREPMTIDTMFDLASLTKVVGTTTAVMMLVESGQI